MEGSYSKNLSTVLMQQIEKKWGLSHVSARQYIFLKNWQNEVFQNPEDTYSFNQYLDFSLVTPWSENSVISYTESAFETDNFCLLTNEIMKIFNTEIKI
jgi:hypothetical protein